MKAKISPNTGIKNRYSDSLLASYFWRSQNQIISVRAVPIIPKNITKPKNVPDQLILRSDSKRNEEANSGRPPAISCQPVNEIRSVPGFIFLIKWQ